MEKKVADVLVAAATLAAILATSCTATPSASDVCDSPPSSASQFLASVNSSAYFIFSSHFILNMGRSPGMLFVSCSCLFVSCSLLIISFFFFSHRNRGSLPVRHYRASPPEEDLQTDQHLLYTRPLRAGELQVLRSQYEKEGMYAGVQTKFNYAWVR